MVDQWQQAMAQLAFYVCQPWFHWAVLGDVTLDGLTDIEVAIFRLATLTLATLGAPL